MRIRFIWDIIENEIVGKSRTSLVCRKYTVLSDSTDLFQCHRLDYLETHSPIYHFGLVQVFVAFDCTAIDSLDT